MLTDGDVERAMDLLADARTTDVLIRELQDASDEGLSVVASSPFRLRHREPLRRMAELVEPIDLAMRNTRVLVRRAAVAAYRREPVPPCVRRPVLGAGGGDRPGRRGAGGRPDADRGAARPCWRWRPAPAGSSAAEGLSAEVVLAQVRSVVADLLRITGMGVIESTDAVPPLSR